MLQTEIGTRGRLSQLERWNAGAFELSAPAARPVRRSGFELAGWSGPRNRSTSRRQWFSLRRPRPSRRSAAGNRRATRPAYLPRRAPSALLHQASLKTETREVPATTAVDYAPAGRDEVRGQAGYGGEAGSTMTSADKPGLAAAQSKLSRRRRNPWISRGLAPPTDDKAGRLAKVDPLAPLPAKHSGKPKDAPTGR